MTRSVPGRSQFDGKPVLEKTCANPLCGKTYETRDPRQRYCGPKCSGRSRSWRYRHPKPLEEATA